MNPPPLTKMGADFFIVTTQVNSLAIDNLVALVVTTLAARWLNSNYSSSNIRSYCKIPAFE